MISFDNRGIGDSDVPPGPYTVADMAADAVRVLDEAGVERAHVVGTSLGGMVAQELALAFPERVDRLVLACTTPGGPRSHPMPAVTVALMAEAAALEPAVALRRFVENALAPATVAERPELVDRIMAHRLATAQSAAAWAAQATAGATFDAYDRLGALRAPTLVQHGGEDVVVDPQNAELLVELLPHARLEPFPGTGHLFFWEEPERFVSLGRVVPGREIMSDRTLTIGRWLADRARATPERVAIRFLDAELTYAELDRRANRLAAGLAERGLARGDRLATLTSTSPDHVATMFACARLGVALQPISWRLAAAEVEYQLGDAEPSLLLVSGEHEELARAAGARIAIARIGDPTLEADTEVEDAARDDDPLLLVYTSGTTGKPKGALLTHANCFWTNVSFDRTTALRDDDVVLQVLPQFHVGGWNVQPLLAWWKGATVVLEPAFDAARALELIAERRVTTMMGVPATYLFLAQEPGFADADLSSLRLAVVGGAPMPEALLETWLERGIEIVQGYGLTEAAPNVLCLPPEDARRKLGFAGKPYPHVDVALRDPDGGALVEGPATGELVVRGPNVFAGYWRNPEATAAAFAEGWLLTGDVAERDAEGFYRIAGRIKDMVISGGENVYPAEIEDVLHGHPAVPRRRSSACRTSGGARPARHSSCFALARLRARASCARSAARALRGSRCRRRSPSSTSCRGRRWGRC